SVRRLPARAGSIAWRRPLSRTANVVTPPDSRFPELAALSCATALVSVRPPFAFFPPLKATHAPPAARITTRPIAAGTSGRFFVATGDGAVRGGRFADIRCVAPPAVGSRIWVLASVCGTALVTGRPVTAPTSAANFATL